LKEHIREIMEVLTVLVSLAGMVISIHHSEFFRKAQDKFSQKMHKNFFWDFMAYSITFFMAIGLSLDLKWLVEFNIIIRPLVLIFAVWASYRLFKHYKRINK
jgi:NhaP-type Na+/H+ or K+/H+ antiporter